jgi:hypothetical protein
MKRKMEFKILTYRELPMKDELLPLMYLAFGWPLIMKSLRRLLRLIPD